MALRYTNSYGYFYKENEPLKGTYIQLPHGHNHEDRIRLAGIDWDMCIFLYNNHSQDTQYYTNYVNEQGNSEEENAKAIDLNATAHYIVNRKTFEKKKRYPITQ